MLLVAMPGHMLCNVWYVCDEGCAWKYCPQLKSVQQLLSAAEALHCAWLQEDAWVEEDTEDDAEADEASDGHIISARAKGKKTAADRNRAARAKDQNTAVEAKHKLKQQRRDLQNVKQLEQELAGAGSLHAVSFYPALNHMVCSGVPEGVCKAGITSPTYATQ